MTRSSAPPVDDMPPRPPGRLMLFTRLLYGDKAAMLAALVLITLIFLAIFGPALVGGPEAPNFRLRNAGPFSLEHGWAYIFGADTLGRPILTRLIMATQLTLTIAFSATLAAAIGGSLLGVIAGYRGGWTETLIMRFADSVMSFPSLLMAVIVLFVFGPQPEYIVIVLMITRLPVYIRVARAEVMELRESVFVEAARVLGAGGLHIVMLHILPLIVPTVLTVMTIDFAVVMLAESSLSFLGIGIQPPSATWGLMVANGRNYLGTAWWVSFFPGMMIVLTALSTNILSNWLRLALDPRQRWRLEKPKGGKQ